LLALQGTVATHKARFGGQSQKSLFVCCKLTQLYLFLKSAKLADI